MKSEFLLVILLVSGIYSSPAPQAPYAGAANPLFTQFQNIWDRIGSVPNQVGNLFRPPSNPQQSQTFPGQSPQFPQIQLPEWPQIQLPQLPQLPQIFQFPFRQPNNQGNGFVLPFFFPNLFNRPAQIAQNQFGQDPTIIIITRPALTEGQGLPPPLQSIPASSEPSINTTNNISTSEHSPTIEASPVLNQNISKPMNSTESSSGIGLTILNENTPSNSTVIPANTTAIDPIAIENV